MGADWDHRDDDVAHAATDQQVQHGVDPDVSLAAQLHLDAHIEALQVHPPPDPAIPGAQDPDTAWSPGFDDAAGAMLDQLVDQALGADTAAAPGDAQAGAAADDPPPVPQDDRHAADPIDDLISQALGHQPPPEAEAPPGHDQSQPRAADHAVATHAEDVADQVQEGDARAHADAAPEPVPAPDDPPPHDPPPHDPPPHDQAWHDPASSAADDPAPWDPLDQLISDALGGGTTMQPWPDPPAESTDQAAAGATRDQEPAQPTVDELIDMALGHDHAPPAPETFAHTEADPTPVLPSTPDEHAVPPPVFEATDPSHDHAGTAPTDADPHAHAAHDEPLLPVPDPPWMPAPDEDALQPHADADGTAWPEHDPSWDSDPRQAAVVPENAQSGPAMAEDATDAVPTNEPRATDGIDHVATHTLGHDAGPGSAVDSVTTGAFQPAQADGSDSQAALEQVLARDRHEHLPPFEPLRAAELEIARDQIAALNAALGTSIPPDRALAAPWTGMHGTATHRRNTSEGWRRDARGFLRDYLDTFGEDRALLEGGMVVTAALAAAWGLDAALIGDRLVHHHLNNGPLVVLLPETLHRQASARIHRQAMVLQPGPAVSSRAGATGV